MINIKNSERGKGLEKKLLIQIIICRGGICMQLIIYPFIVCVGIFLIQLFFIIRKNKIVYNDIQKKDKKHWKLVIKI